MEIPLHTMAETPGPLLCMVSAKEMVLAQQSGQFLALPFSTCLENKALGVNLLLRSRASHLVLLATRL